MSAGHNATLHRFLALLASGEVARARQGATSSAEWAARLGMTDGAFRGVRRRAEQLGHAVPKWDSGDFEDEEPTVRVEPVEPAPFVQLPADSSNSEAPPLPAIGNGFHVRAKSTLVRPDGSIAGQWIKTAANSNAVDPVEVLRAAFADGVPKSAPVEQPEYCDSDLLACIAFGDPHFGQLSWHRDAGANFDLEIAERNMVTAVSHLVAIAPAAEQCLLIWIGDNVHADGQANTTTKGTRVDVDGRTIKMLSIAIRAFRKAIDLALAKFGKVHGIVERGNHDELLSAVIALALSQHYENDPRVTIDTSPEMFHWYRFGQNLIGTHHGDKARPIDLLGVMANDRAQDWGETKYRRFYCGHIHHEVVKEVPGLTVEYLRTLAPADAWHRGKGYRSGRDLRLDVFHREYGMINRHIIGIEQVIKHAG